MPRWSVSFAKVGAQVKPSIGRIVLYHFDNVALAFIAPSPCERPAIVTSVRENGRVNLHVLFEPDDLDTKDNWEQDRNHRFDVDECHYDATGLLCVDSTGSANIAGTWSWPPRVG